MVEEHSVQLVAVEVVVVGLSASGDAWSHAINHRGGRDTPSMRKLTSTTDDPMLMTEIWSLYGLPNLKLKNSSAAQSDNLPADNKDKDVFTECTISQKSSVALFSLSSTKCLNSAKSPSKRTRCSFGFC